MAEHEGVVDRRIVLRLQELVLQAVQRHVSIRRPRVLTDGSSVHYSLKQRHLGADACREKGDCVNHRAMARSGDPGSIPLLSNEGQREARFHPLALACAMVASSAVSLVLLCPCAAGAGEATQTVPIVDHPTPTTTPPPTSTRTASFTPTSCVSDPPLVNRVTSPTNQLVQTISGYSRGLFCFRGGRIEVRGIEVVSQSQTCEGAFEVTVQLQPNQVNDFMVCLRPGLCGLGGCTAVEIVQTSSEPTAADTTTATPTPTPTPCPGCTLLGHLFVSGPSVDPPHPVVGDQVTFTFPVNYALPGSFDCEHCTFEGGEGYLAGEDSPVLSGDTVVVQRRVVRAGSTTVELHVRETTESSATTRIPWRVAGRISSRPSSRGHRPVQSAAQRGGVLYRRLRRAR